MAFPENIQTKINDLLVALVEVGDSNNLFILLNNGFTADDPNKPDLITIAAGIGDIGDGRNSVLSVIISNTTTSTN